MKINIFLLQSNMCEVFIIQNLKVYFVEEIELLNARLTLNKSGVVSFIVRKAEDS